MTDEPVSFINYWYLLMAKKVLARTKEPNDASYKLAKDIFASKDRLGLKWPEEFSMNFGASKKMEERGGLDMNDGYAVAQVKKKIDVIRDAVDERLKTIDRKTVHKGDLERNIDLIKNALKFDNLQGKVLLFFACMPKGHFATLLRALYPETVSYEDYIAAIATLLDERPEDIHKVLEPENTLVGMQFLKLDGKPGGDSVHGLDKGIQPILTKQYKSVEELLNEMLGPQPKSELTEENFSYMQTEFDEIAKTVQGYIKSKKHERKNITFAGPPGTGKTEGVAVLAIKLGVKAFLVGTAKKTQGSGYSVEEPTREDRISALIRSAFIVRQTRMDAILVVDEAEDILRDLNREDTKETGSKAFTNEILENLGVPVVFISNRTDLFDPATIRRILPFYHFDYMPLPERTKAVVSKVEKYIGTKLSSEDAEIIAERAEHLTIAVIDTCIRSVGKRLEQGSDEAVVKQAIENEIVRAITAACRGIPPLPHHVVSLGERFDPALISVSENAARLRQQFASAAKNGMQSLAGLDVIIMGQQGTGRKTLAKYLVEATGLKPVIIPFDTEMAFKGPYAVHARDLAHAGLDGRIVIFDNAEAFSQIISGHPLMERVRAHKLPSIFIAGLEGKDGHVERLAQEFTVSMRTGCLSDQQVVRAAQNIANIELSAEEARRLPHLTVSDFTRAARSVRATGQATDVPAFVARLNSVRRMGEEVGRNSGFGFQPRLVGGEGFGGGAQPMQA
jgi:signal recognition particle receptor subunit beta